MLLLVLGETYGNIVEILHEVSSSSVDLVSDSPKSPCEETMSSIRKQGKSERCGSALTTFIHAGQWDGTHIL